MKVEELEAGGGESRILGCGRIESASDLAWCALKGVLLLMGLVLILPFLIPLLAVAGALTIGLVCQVMGLMVGAIGAAVGLAVGLLALVLKLAIVGLKLVFGVAGLMVSLLPIALCVLGILWLVDKLGERRSPEV